VSWAINVYLHLQVIKSCLIWTSLCMLFEVVTIDLHYRTDRQERFDLKISKLKLLQKKKTPTYWMPLR